jgi:hypothetical protein
MEIFMDASDNSNSVYIGFDFDCEESLLESPPTATQELAPFVGFDYIF